MMLKDSLMSPAANTSVIVTISPASKDTEHSLNSLRHACVMDGQDTTKGGTEKRYFPFDEEMRRLLKFTSSDFSCYNFRFLSGGLTTSVTIGEVNLTSISRQRKALSKQGKGQDLKTCNGNFIPGRQPCTFGDGHSVPDRESKDKSRRCSKKVSLHGLSIQLKTEILRCREELGLEQHQLQRLEGVPVQMLKKALNKAGIPQEQGQLIVDENINHMNSTLRTPPFKHEEIEVNSGCDVTKMLSTEKIKKRSSIVAAVLNLDNRDENAVPNTTSKHCNDEFCKSTSLIKRGSVTRESVSPVVFRGIPTSYCKTVVSQHGLDSINSCADEIDIDSHVRGSICGKVRVNKAAALRQQYAAERAKKFEKERLKEKKKAVHKNRWSNATASRECHESRNNAVSKECEANATNPKVRQGGEMPSFRLGRPWAMGEQQSSENAGGMFFEVTGEIDNYAQANDRRVTDSFLDERSTSQCDTDLHLRRYSAGSVWSVELARNRYGNASDYN